MPSIGRDEDCSMICLWVWCLPMRQDIILLQQASYSLFPSLSMCGRMLWTNLALIHQLSLLGSMFAEL